MTEEGMVQIFEAIQTMAEAAKSLYNNGSLVGSVQLLSVTERYLSILVDVMAEGIDEPWDQVTEEEYLPLVEALAEAEKRLGTSALKQAAKDNAEGFARQMFGGLHD